MAFSCKNLSTATKKDLFQVLGAPESEELTRLDGDQLSDGLPKTLVKAAEWADWVGKDEEDIRIFDFGQSFPKGEEPVKLAQPSPLRAPETIFEKSFDYRVDLWCAGSMVSFLDHKPQEFTKHLLIDLFFHIWNDPVSLPR